MLTRQSFSGGGSRNLDSNIRISAFTQLNWIFARLAEAIGEAQAEMTGIMFKRIKKLWITCLVLFLILSAVFIFFIRKPAGVVEPQEIKWGVAFSKYFTEKLGLDWQDTYSAILNDLKPKYLRLPIYWQDVEPQSGVYNFSDYDWMVSEAQKRNVKLILVIGRKMPRWPECHLPAWAVSLSEGSQQTRLLKVIPEIVDHYKNLDNLYLWQVENEPFLPFGECPRWSADFLDKEIELVRSLDQTHKIIITDSGELSFWLPSAKRADVFGTTMYRVIWNKYLGYFKYPLPPRFFWLKANLVHLFYPSKAIVVSELQAEPWARNMPYETPLAEQFKSMDFNQFKENIAYARQVGFPAVYLWGAEWWYWLKTKHNDERFWEAAREIISPN